MTFNALNSGPILLLGSTGRLGKSLLNGLTARKCQIFAPKRNELDFEWPDFDECLKKYQPAVIINCAAFNGPEQCEENGLKAKRINSYCVGILAQYARQTGALLIHYSTDYVFDGSKKEALTEESETNPVNAYGWSKLNGEKNIRDHNPCHLIFRVSSIYGDDLTGPLNVLKQAAAGKGTINNPIEVLHQLCNPISVRKITELTLEIMEEMSYNYWRLLSGNYHMITDESIWKRDFAVDTLKMAYGINKHFYVREGGLPIKRPIYCNLSSSKIQMVFENGNYTSANADMAETIEYLKERNLIPSLG
ncbi:MAG: SDR family oxidoreductase [Patescibacteria group bacterium]|nr:SDR family oxidoreductase [Patescibacteria group bacterium]